MLSNRRCGCVASPALPALSWADLQRVVAVVEQEILNSDVVVRRTTSCRVLLVSLWKLWWDDAFAGRRSVTGLV
jgi:hypothetical protein